MITLRSAHTHSNQLKSLKSPSMQFNSLELIYIISVKNNEKKNSNKFVFFFFLFQNRSCNPIHSERVCTENNQQKKKHIKTRIERREGKKLTKGTRAIENKGTECASYCDLFNSHFYSFVHSYDSDFTFTRVILLIFFFCSFDYKLLCFLDFHSYDNEKKKNYIERVKTATETTKNEKN